MSNYFLGKIKSDSMAPLLEVDEIVLCKKIKRNDEIHKNKIYGFIKGESIIFHRCLGLNRNNYFNFSGDNDFKKDIVKKSRIVFEGLFAVHNQKRIKLEGIHFNFYTKINYLLTFKSLMTKTKYRWIKYYFLKHIKKILW